MTGMNNTPDNRAEQHPQAGWQLDLSSEEQWQIAEEVREAVGAALDYCRERAKKLNADDEEKVKAMMGRSE